LKRSDHLSEELILPRMVEGTRSRLWLQTTALLEISSLESGSIAHNNCNYWDARWFSAQSQVLGRATQFIDKSAPEQPSAKYFQELYRVLRHMRYDLRRLQPRETRYIVKTLAKLVPQHSRTERPTWSTNSKAPA